MIHEAQSGIVLEVFRQIDGRPQIPLMTRTRSIGKVWGWVKAVGILSNVHLQIAIGTNQAPLGNDSPIRKELDAVRAAVHLVRGNERNDDVRGRWAPFEKRRAWLCRSQIRVLVIERRNVRRKCAGCLNSITYLVGKQVLGLELMATEHRYYGREWSGVQRGRRRRRYHRGV